jgi:hypothetical protein
MIRTNNQQQNNRHDEDIDHLKALIAQLIKENSKR